MHIGLTRAQTIRAEQLALGNQTFRALLRGHSPTVAQVGPWAAGGHQHGATGAGLIVNLTRPLTFSTWLPEIGYGQNVSLGYMRALSHVTASGTTRLMVYVSYHLGAVVAIVPTDGSVRIAPHPRIRGKRNLRLL
jgi:hypothetical protein